MESALPTDDLRPNETTTDLPARTDAALYFIGRISTPWAERSACPKRGTLDGPPCRLSIEPPWRAALEGVAAGDMLQVLYWMHLARRDLTRQVPRGRPAPIGTFALRSPMRPNPIASSLVRCVAVEHASLVVTGLDCVDGTPLLDIKPERCPMTGG